MIGKIWRNSLNGKKELNKGLWEGSVNQDIFRDPGNRMNAPLSSEVCSWGPSSRI